MLLIYGSPLSPPTNKVRFTANYVKLLHEFHVINLATGEQRTPEFLKINPYGRVPAIDDDGFKLAESNAIMRYITDKQNSDVYPRELHTRAVVDQWVDYILQHVGLSINRIMFNTYFYKIARVPRDERALQDGHHFLEQYLSIIEQQLSHHPFLTGDKITLADISLLSALDPCEVNDIDLLPYKSICSWRNKLTKEAFYKDCHESYSDVFNKVLAEIAQITS